MILQGTYRDDYGNKMIITKPFPNALRIRVNSESVQINIDTLQDFLHVIDTQELTDD